MTVLAFIAAAVVFAALAHHFGAESRRDSLNPTVRHRRDWQPSRR